MSATARVSARPGADPRALIQTPPSPTERARPPRPRAGLGWPVRPRDGLPDLATHAGPLAVMIVQTLAGERPYGQLARWLDGAALAAVVAGLDGRRPKERRPIRRIAVRSIRVQHPHPRAAEVTAHLLVDGRSLPMALRFDVVEDRWLCSALAVPQTTSEVWME